MNSPTYNKVGFAMSLVTTIQGSLTCVVTIIIIGLIVYHQLKNQMKRQDRITLILCANIELCLLLCSTLLTLTNTFTLLGDLYELEFNTSSCVVRGYITLATISSLYYGFAVQVSINNRTSTGCGGSCSFSLGFLPSLSHRVFHSSIPSNLLAVSPRYTHSVPTLLRVALPTTCVGLHRLSSERALLFRSEYSRQFLDVGFHVFLANQRLIVHVRENPPIHASPIALSDDHDQTSTNT